MKRRTFMFQASAAAAATACSPAIWAQSGPQVAAELTLAEGPFAAPLPLTYNGLSYELSQLTDPQFFSAANRDLVAHFRLLSPNGVLRVGGNTSEFCWFQADASTQAPKLRVPPGKLEDNWMPHRLFAVTPEAIDALAGFLKATGWKLIYGLNFGNSTPERAAREAAYVAHAVGERLEYFQIGNEPDFYQDAINGTRPPGWGFADYLQEWAAYAEAIAAAVPTARFGGPDVGASSDWVTRFGAEIPDKVRERLKVLTGHYYAEGPPNDPRVTTERLLAGNPKIASEMQKIEAVARAHGLVYRMTEGNSCYRGGKPGMSNAFAAALWAGDYMLAPRQSRLCRSESARRHQRLSHRWARRPYAGNGSCKDAAGNEERFLYAHLYRAGRHRKGHAHLLRNDARQPVCRLHHASGAGKNPGRECHCLRGSAQTPATRLPSSTKTNQRQSMYRSACRARCTSRRPGDCRLPRSNQPKESHWPAQRSEPMQSGVRAS